MEKCWTYFLAGWMYFITSRPVLVLMTIVLSAAIFGILGAGVGISTEPELYEATSIQGLDNVITSSKNAWIGAYCGLGLGAIASCVPLCHYRLFSSSANEKKAGAKADNWFRNDQRKDSAKVLALYVLLFASLFIGVMYGGLIGVVIAALGMFVFGCCHWSDIEWCFNGDCDRSLPAVRRRDGDPQAAKDLAEEGPETEEAQTPSSSAAAGQKVFSDFCPDYFRRRLYESPTLEERLAHSDTMDTSEIILAISLLVLIFSAFTFLRRRIAGKST